MRGDRNWSIDKHIPVAVILTIFLQTAAAFWWAATVSSRIEQLEKRDTATSTQGERLIKLETKFDALIDSVNEVKALLRTPRSSQ